MAAIHIVLKRELIQVKQQIPYSFTPFMWFFQQCPFKCGEMTVKHKFNNESYNY